MVSLDDVRYILNFVLADFYAYLDDDMINGIVEEVILRLDKGDFIPHEIDPPSERPLLYKEFKMY